eukprot:TRINITY_DN15285_c0_g4_i1.p1 TRINITY_DN15285_c0_g4~~TRINITY_DN15285_c0_g4_i1.p1  ORF type:complete len:366 (+),score=167.22 TRINITY_DN15285_c0_g4_i1:1096-2193(+)
MQVELRIANNVIGTEIPEELAADIENYEELEETTKQSRFWITYEFAGKEYKTAEKVWRTDFQQLEPGKGRCDFGYNLLQHLPPSKELRDQLQKGVLFKLWEMKPVIVKPKTEEEKPKVALTEDKKIQQETLLLGLLKVELHTWLSDILNRKPQVYGKFKLYSPELLTRPEFMLQNEFFVCSLGEKDLKLMNEVAKLALEEHEKKLLSEAEQVQEKQKGDKGKKEAKKVAKKGAKDAVQAAEVEDVEAPEQPGYVVIERNCKAGVSAYLAEKNRAKQLKMKADSAKKKTEEVDEEKEEALKKEEGMKRMQKYFDVIIGQDLDIILRIKMNGLEAKKVEEEPKEAKKEDKSKKKDAKKEVKKAVKKK